MSAECFSAIHLCRIRATRLDSTGNPVAGPNNSYVSDKPIMLGATPQIEAGQDKTLVGGCDCIVAQYRGYDKLKYFTLELDLAELDPALMEMLLGSTAIVKTGDVIGNWWAASQTFNCSTTVQPNICFEGWQDTWDDDHQASSPFRYVHWIWPSSFWQIAAHTLQNDFLQPKLTGFTRGNTNWDDIYHDLPELPGALGGFFFTDTIPGANCGYLTHTIT
jgi:hypothetical protein